MPAEQQPTAAGGVKRSHRPRRSNKNGASAATPTASGDTAVPASANNATTAPAKPDAPRQHQQPREGGRGRGAGRGGYDAGRGRGRGGSAKPAVERDAAPSEDEYGAPKGPAKKNNNRKAKNTESFDPSHAPAAMRLVVDTAAKKMSIKPTVRDLTLHPTLFTQPGDEKLYAKLTAEVEAFESRRDTLKSWHGDSHWIADDSTGWKKHAPTFNMVIERIKAYFSMNVQATRFNWYKDQSEWKPFHHDAAAVKPEMAKKQNFTVGVSFGCTRDAAFEDAETKKVLSLPLTDGSTYCFARDTNILWRHGILQVPPGQQKQEGRISVIAWGWVDQDEVNAPPAKLRK
jgi:hypothetical protein